MQYANKSDFSRARAGLQHLIAIQIFWEDFFSRESRTPTFDCHSNLIAIQIFLEEFFSRAKTFLDFSLNRHGIYKVLIVF